MPGRSGRGLPPLLFFWALAVVALVVALGVVWRSADRFLLTLLVWAVVVSPLVVRTIRWLGHQQED